MRILILDNYDSFTWNLVDALESAGGSCLVRRSDQICLSEIEALQPERIVISPGPFGPDQSGVCPQAVQQFGGRIPILGVCLGMQVIARTAGAIVRPSGCPMHGKASRIHHDGKGILRGLPNPFWGGRYHSLIVDKASVPEGLAVTAWTDAGEIMGCRIRGQAVEGVLFHPESFLTEQRARLFENFLETPAHVV